VNEGPDHPIVHAQALFSQLGDQPRRVKCLPQRCSSQSDSPDQLLRPIAPIWSGATLRSAIRFTQSIAV